MSAENKIYWLAPGMDLEVLKTRGDFYELAVASEGGRAYVYRGDVILAPGKGVMRRLMLIAALPVKGLLYAIGFLVVVGYMGPLLLGGTGLGLVVAAVAGLLLLPAIVMADVLGWDLDGQARAILFLGLCAGVAVIIPLAIIVWPKREWWQRPTGVQKWRRDD